MDTESSQLSLDNLAKALHQLEDSSLPTEPPPACFLCGKPSDGTADAHYKPVCSDCHGKLQPEQKICFLCGQELPKQINFRLDIWGHKVCNDCYSWGSHSNGIWIRSLESTPPQEQLDKLVSYTTKESFPPCPFKLGDLVVATCPASQLKHGWVLGVLGNPQKRVGVVIEHHSGMTITTIHYPQLCYQTKNKIYLRDYNTYALYVDPAQLRLATIDDELADYRTQRVAISRAQRQVKAEKAKLKNTVLWEDLPETKCLPYTDFTTSQIRREWGLDHLELHELASDYYILLDLELDFPSDSRLKASLEILEARLADQFQRYLTASIGGEVRYARSNSSKLVGIPKDQATPDVETLLSYIPYNRNSRFGFWACWKQILQTEGELSMLTACYQLFSISNLWDGSIGGKKWQTVTKTLLDFLKGETSRRIFVDTCWGLQHNSNIVYDKVWDVTSLSHVLEANLNGELYKLFYYCSSETTKLYKELTKREPRPLTYPEKIAMRGETKDDDEEDEDGEDDDNS